MYYIIICQLCGHRAISPDISTAKLERNRHYHYCHKNLKPYSNYVKRVTITRVSDGMGLRIILPALALMSEGKKPPIKIAV